MPKRKRPEDKPEEQFKRFVEAAQEHEIPDDGSPLEKAFGSLKKSAKRAPTRTSPQNYKRDEQE